MLENVNEIERPSSDLHSLWLELRSKSWLFRELVRFFDRQRLRRWSSPSASSHAFFRFDDVRHVVHFNPETKPRRGGSLPRIVCKRLYIHSLPKKKNVILPLWLWLSVVCYIYESLDSVALCIVLHTARVVYTAVKFRSRNIAEPIFLSDFAATWQGSWFFRSNSSRKRTKDRRIGRARSEMWIKKNG